MSVNADTAYFLQIASPALVVGAALWKIGHLWRLRCRQRDAIRSLCDLILELTQFQDFSATIEQLGRLNASRDFFERTVIGEKTPLGLMDEVIEINTLIAAINNAWTAFLQRTPTNQVFDPFSDLRAKAQRLRNRARLVIYTF